MEREESIKLYLQEAWGLRRAGDYKSSREILEKAHKLCRDDDHMLKGRIYHIYMQYEYDHGNLEKAIEFCKSALSYYKMSGNKNLIAHSTRHLADLQLALDFLDEAEKNYAYALDIYRKDTNSHPGDIANTLRGFGMLMEKKMNFSKAIEVWKEVLNLYTKLGIKEGIDEAEQEIKKLEKKLL